MQRWPESPEDLRRFIRQFEEGQWPKKCWNHRAHVTMSAYYLIVMPWGEADELSLLAARFGAPVLRAFADRVVNLLAGVQMEVFRQYL